MSTSIVPQLSIIKYRIQLLRNIWGDCLNLWPPLAQREYQTLARKKQEMENK